MTTAAKPINPKIQTVSIDALKRDYHFYPRESVDFITVGRFMDAMKAGAKFPPIRACAKTGKIIDGFHRYAAYSELGIKEVEVVGEEVKDDADFFLRAVEANKAHGLGYRGIDYEKIFKITKLLKLERTKVAFAMALPIQKFEELARTTPAGGVSPIKPGSAYIQSARNRIDPLPNDRERTSKPLGYFFFFNQAITFLKSTDCDISRQDVLYKLRELETALSAKLNPHGKSLNTLVLPEPVKEYHMRWAEREGMLLANHVVERLIFDAELDAENSDDVPDEERAKWQKRFRPFTVLNRET